MLIRNTELMHVVIHVDEVTQRNFAIHVSPSDDAGQKLIRYLGWRQG